VKIKSETQWVIVYFSFIVALVAAASLYG